MTPLTNDVHGEPPLTGRLEPWMTDLLADPSTCARLIETHGSPVNVLDTGPMRRNANQLLDAAESAGVAARLFFARKANKALAFVDEALHLGQGVDVASEAELVQSLDRGARGPDIIVSAAVKSSALLTRAVRAGATISVDHVAELEQIRHLAESEQSVAHVAPRLALPPSSGLPASRFGELAPAWREALAAPDERLSVDGVHFHLHGYAADDRLTGLEAAVTLVDELAAAGHRPRFVDIGGGVPMSYLDDQQQWSQFWEAVERQRSPEAEGLTWKGRSLANVYPYHQRPVRGEWLTRLLEGRFSDGRTAAPALRSRGLRLHLEPGRALLDGCGLTLARVAFLKQRSDGVPLVGLEMNRTQCRSTSDDFLIDPILVRTQQESASVSGFLVGAYCIEDELILLRRMTFPRGVARGDVVGFVNTAGYLMHILESASHQIPLARNVVRTDDGFRPDAIDDASA